MFWIWLIPLLIAFVFLELEHIVVLFRGDMVQESYLQTIAILITILAFIALTHRSLAVDLLSLTGSLLAALYAFNELTLISKEILAEEGNSWPTGQ